MNPVNLALKALGKRAVMLMPGVFLVTLPYGELGRTCVWRVSPRICIVARPKSGEEKTAGPDVGAKVKAWILRAVG
ncbi:hypothetical protein L6R50_14820 [Myxococcota bacterium]|nr:hypothetical protein [Myxococcota bacterium]